MPFSNFPSGFAQGLMVRNMPLLQMQPGQVFWVNNSSVLRPQQHAGSDSSGSRGTYLDPFATIAYALTQCLASRGDIIFVGPGHAETIANATTLALNVAGVAVIGVGSGSLRPTLTFTAAAANIPVTAANVSLQNLLFVANFADVVSFLTATGTATPKDFAIDNCEFRDTSTILNALTVFTGNATANSCDGFSMTNCRIKSVATTAATTAIKLSSATDRAKISGNFGVWAVLNDTAAMLATGASNMTAFEFSNNVLERPNTSSTGGSFISTSGTSWTGHAYGNHMYQLDNTAGIWIATGTGGAFGFSQNYSPITGAVDKSALINPAAV
jgi:hypothetical protein